MEDRLRIADGVCCTRASPTLPPLLTLYLHPVHRWLRRAFSSAIVLYFLLFAFEERTLAGWNGSGVTLLWRRAFAAGGETPGVRRSYRVA